LVWREPAIDSGPPTSFFKGIKHLGAGAYVIADLRKKTVSEHVYWELPKPAADTDLEDSRSEADCIEAYADILRDSTKKCLMSDVEYGALLSGGIDSVAMCAFAAEAGSFHTFSALSLSTFTNLDSRFSHLAARQLGLENHQVLFDWREPQVTPEQWKDLVWLCEMPNCGPEQLYKYQLYRSAKSLRPNLKVMLIGQGSDEFNGGYSTSLAGTDGADGWPAFMSVLAEKERSQLLRGTQKNMFYPELFAGQELLTRDFLIEEQQDRDVPSTPLEHYLRVKYRDLQMYNCWHEDRTAAGNSVENRVPFLDHRIVELAVKVPARHRASLIWDKRILRDGMLGRLPKEFCQRSKVPFFYGKGERYTHRMFLELIVANGYALLDEAFSNTSARSIFKKDAIDVIIRRVEADPEGLGVERLMNLINMSLLDSRAADLAAEAPRAIGTRIPDVMPIDDWDACQGALAARLAKGTEGAEGATEGLGASSIMDFAQGVYLVQRERKAAMAQSEWYVVMEETVRYTLTPSEDDAWIRVMREIDGRRTLGEIVSVAQVSLNEIRKNLDEAVEFGVLEAVSQPAS
jgi:asparagine synthase (glutamine-hydrolysing)